MTDSVAVGDLGSRGHAFLVSVEGFKVTEADGIETCHGWGLGYPEPFTGAFAMSGRLWFQSGASRWDTDTIAHVQQVKEKLRRVTYRLDISTTAPASSSP